MEGQAHAGEQDPNRRTVVGLGRGAEGKTMGHGTEENSETLKDLGHGSEADCGTVEQETTSSDPEDHGAMAELHWRSREPPGQQCRQEQKSPQWNR